MAADLFDSLFRTPIFAPRVESQDSRDIVAVSDLPGWRHQWQTGEKFAGGLGPVNILTTDYWSLRARSAELYETNLYARGLIRRLVTNEINTGLHLEATPEEAILGYPEDGLADWSETVENRFHVWGKNSYLCDHNERLTFGALQQEARREALVVGDVLVVIRQDQRTRLPRIQLINGANVQTPLESPAGGNRIQHGVEIDSQGRHVAYWVQQSFAKYKRLPAFGEKSGRRIAWLLYGSDKRMDDVRGKPLLALVLQSLKEIDRYRDSVQRKALINSMIATFITKTVDKPGTRPIGTGAIRKGLDITIDTTGQKRAFRTAESIPGQVIDELQVGEEPKAFPSNGTDERFGGFEDTIMAMVASGNEIPPEIYRLAFTKNYSASQAAVNEFKTYLNKARTTFGEGFCGPVYEEWLVAEVLARRIEAPGFLEAWRSWELYDKLGAWISCDWSGNIKPAVDPSKLAASYEAMAASGFITRDRASRELTGTKYSKNVQKLLRENKALAEALKPLAELEASKKPTPAPGASAQPPGGGGGSIDSEPDDEDEDDDADEEEAVVRIGNVRALR
jgi:lambda family phage portal protein